MKKLLSIVLALTLILALVGCTTTKPPPAGETNPGMQSQAPESTAPKAKIGVLLPSLSFDFQAKMAAGVKRAAEEFGYGYQEVDYNFDGELQMSGAETLATSGVLGYYGIFLNAEGANTMMAKYPEIGTISQSADSNANAIMLNDYIDMGNQFVDAVNYFRTENNIEGGQMAALWLDGCQVVGTDFNDAMVDMKKIMTEYCEGEGLEYVSDQFPVTDEDAANVVEQLLNAYPNLRYIFCFNNGYAIAAANEISSARSDASEYFVFSSEGDAESFRLISSGTSPYRGCAYNDIEQSGYEAGLQLINWIENGKIEDVVVIRTLVDIRNVADYM